MKAHSLQFSNTVELIGARDVEALGKLLDQPPELVRERSSAPRGATLLHFGSFNGTEELAHRAPARAARTDRAGSDVRARPGRIFSSGDGRFRAA